MANESSRGLTELAGRCCRPSTGRCRPSRRAHVEPSPTATSTTSFARPRPSLGCRRRSSLVAELAVPVEVRPARERAVSHARARVGLRGAIRVGYAGPGNSDLDGKDSVPDVAEPERAAVVRAPAEEPSVDRDRADVPVRSGRSGGPAGGRRRARREVGRHRRGPSEQYRSDAPREERALRAEHEGRGPSRSRVDGLVSRRGPSSPRPWPVE